MNSFGITASVHTACISSHVTKKQSSQARKVPESLRTKQGSQDISLKVEGQEHPNLAGEGENVPLPTYKLEQLKEDMQHGTNAETLAPKFFDHRWKNGTWDLNMFVKKGKLDWDEVIVAEARRRKFLELHPDAATNEDPVLFRTSIIPWWAWIMHSHLPEAELLNGRAAMIGFFMAYIVDALTGLDVVGQTGNFICKTALFITIIGIVLFRRRDDIGNLQKLADEATFYDKQWQASWQVKDNSSDTSEKGRKKI